MSSSNSLSYTALYYILLFTWVTTFQIIDNPINRYAYAANNKEYYTENIKSTVDFGPDNIRTFISTNNFLHMNPNAVSNSDDSNTLELAGGETMTISGVTSTLRGSVLVIENSLLNMINPPKSATALTITRDLTVGNDSSQGMVEIYGAMRVGNNLNIHNGTVTNGGILSIDGTLSAAAGGSLTLLESSLTTLSADSLLKDVNTINEANFAGTINCAEAGAGMMLTGWKNSTISRDDYDKLVNTLKKISVNDSLSAANIALWGVTVVQADGTPLVTLGSGEGYLLAGDKITMTNASANHIQAGATYVAPQIVLDESSDTLIVGNSNDISGELTTIGLPAGTINLVQKADGSVGNVQVQRKGSYTIGSGKRASGVLGNLEAAGTVTVNQGMQLAMNELFLNKGFVSVSGTHDLPTFVHANRFTSEQGTLFIDTATVSFDNMSHDTLNSKVILGKGAVLGIGSMRGASHAGLWARQQQNFTEAHTGTSLSGVLAISKAFTLETGKMGGQLIVDSSAQSDGSIGTSGTKPQHDIYFGDSSLLVIDASSADIQRSAARGEALIRPTEMNTSIYISDTAHLRLHEAKGNRDYIIIGWEERPQDSSTSCDDANAAGNVSAGGAIKGWTGSQISTNTDMLSGNTVYTNDGIVTRFSVNDAGQVYNGLSDKMAEILNGMYNLGANDLNSYHNGIQFLTRVTDNTNTYITKGTEARAIEGATRLAAVAGVHTSALATAEMGTTASLNRASQNMYTADQQIRSALQQPHSMWKNLVGISSGDEAAATSIALWLSPLYQTTSTQAYSQRGFSSGTSSSLQGLAFGVDFIEDDTERWGIAYNIGTGSSASRGDFAKSSNNFKFYGTNTYRSWFFNDFNLISDVGISHITHNLQQKLPVLMDVPVLHAQLQTTIANTGIRGEYLIENDFMDIIPHIGLRYSFLFTGPFETRNKDVLFSTAASIQNIFSFPVGITAGKIWYNANNWLIKCYASAGLTLNMGDCVNTAQVTMPGIGELGNMSTPIADAVNGNASLGVQVKKSDLDFGFQYSLLSSRHSTNHSISGTLTYTF